MSAVYLPTKEQCEGWSTEQVADFLTQNGMQQCSATIRRMKIDGLWLLNLSDNDLSRFGLMHQPQLQKMVEDIKKNDGSILNRLKRLKNKPPPKVPTRDYNADEDGDTDEWSGSEFDSDTYEDPLEDQDDSYEPPPSEKGKRAFTPQLIGLLPQGEYVDSLRDRPSHTHRKPVHPPRDPKPLLPPKPAQTEEDNEDYINPEEGADDDYIEPSEKPTPSKPTEDTRVKPATSRPAVSNAESDRSNSPDLYEVPDPEDSAPSVSRLSAHLNQTLPPRASPRHHVKKPPPAPEPVENEEDEYEICDADEDEDVKSKESTLPAIRPPKPRPRGMNKPSLPLKPKADLPNTEHEARPISSKNNVQSPLPLPPDSTKSRTTRGQGAAPAPRNGRSAAEEEAGVYKKAWYASTCDRRAAEEALTRYKKDGAFLVRKSSGQDPSQPYTLVVLYKGRVYNIPVRHIHQTHQYALGREKKGEERFSSVSDIIENHQRNPLVLIDIQNNTKDSTKLQHAVRP